MTHTPHSSRVGTVAAAYGLTWHRPPCLRRACPACLTRLDDDDYCPNWPVCDLACCPCHTPGDHPAGCICTWDDSPEPDCLIHGQDAS